MTNPNLTENEFTADLGLDPVARELCGFIWDIGQQVEPRTNG